MIVIDVGCARHGDDYSIERLVEEFHPSTLIGFDPQSDYPLISHIAGTRVIAVRAAAWLHDGTTTFEDYGLRAHVGGGIGHTVQCFDLASVIAECWEETVLKLDCEGGEYRLLAHLHDRGVDELLELAIVEWHHAESMGESRAYTEDRLRCEVREWPW